MERYGVPRQECQNRSFNDRWYRFEENPSTGFRWVFESSSKASEEVSALVSDSFEKGEAIGQPGTHRWVFRAQRAGSGTISLSFQRSWEEKQSPARNFTLEVRVNE